MVIIRIFKDAARNILIKAKDIQMGNNVSFGRDIDIDIFGHLSIDDRSILGKDIVIRGNNITIGKDLFHSKGLRIGGGGRLHPNANLKIGDRCTIHNNFINLCENVDIGNDVGLSPESAILTHGYWLSVLDGFPAGSSSVKIGNGVIIGFRSLVMMGVTIGKNCVVGVNSVVTKDLKPNSIYAGNPAKFIRKVIPLDKNERELKVNHIISVYKNVAQHHGISPSIILDYPTITVNECVFNVEKLTFEGREDLETDDFRDYVRKWGLRFYSERPFKSVLRM